MTDKPTSFAVNDVARVLGVSSTWVRDQIKTGGLKAATLPTTGEGERRRRRVSREDLAHFLVRHGLQASHIRRFLNPNGYLLALQCGSDVSMALAYSASPTRFVPTLFHLGRALGAEAVWGVVVDLSLADPVEVHRALREFAQERDRPELIGLYPDDGMPASFTKSNPFDVMIPLATGPAGIARSVVSLRPQG